MNFSRLVPGVSSRGGWLAAVVMLTVSLFARPCGADAQPVSLTTLHDFLGNAETAPFGKLLEYPAPPGIHFLGTSQRGGNGNGTILQVTHHSDGSETVLPVYTFSVPDPATGINPDGSQPNTLTPGPDGNFYGTTLYGGAYGNGTVFRVTPDGGFVTLYSFGVTDAASQVNADGAVPRCTLLLGADNNFYGTTSTGGANGFGTVFEIAPGDGPAAITTLCSFDASIGANALPHSLAQDTSGNFYGISFAGGPAGAGTIFAVAAADHTLTVYDFVGSGAGNGDGVNPGPLILADDGNFYGTTAAGGSNSAGTIFRFTPGNPPVVIYAFGSSGGSDGATPGNLTRIGSTFYGVTQKGGSNQTGTIFEYSPGGAEVIIHNFPATAGTPATNTDGASPAVIGLTLASDNLFYGLTAKGGSNGNGTIFTLTLDASDGTGFTVLSSFPTLASPDLGDAAGPVAGLILGSGGNFYGTASRGGDDNNGAIFQFNPSSEALSNLYSFDILLDGLNDYGANPQAAFVSTLGGASGDLLLGASSELIENPDGTFYGTAHDGGPGGTGTVFKITLDGTPTLVHAFGATDVNGDNTDGAYPTALIQNGDGTFYGTTYGGGAGGTGTVFEITAGGAFGTLYNFGSAGTGDGAGPVALIRGSDGIFYGTTSNGGGNGTGTIFQFSPGGIPTVAYSFSAVAGDPGTNPEGANPTSLIAGNDGSLYGTTEYGGTSGHGTVFQFVPTSTAPVSFHTFSDTNGDGANPVAPLLQASDGNFYGTTYAGGSGEVGAVFQITPAGVATPLYSFGGDDGSHPLGRLLEAPDGYLYGTTYDGGSSRAGTIFRFQVAPTITSALDVSAQVGTSFSYHIIGAFQPTAFDAQGLPPGLTVDPAIGLVGGTPTQEGLFNVTLLATNSGGTGTAALTITVLPASPVITSGQPPAGQVGVAYSYQIAASGSPSSYGATGLPDGLNIDPASGLIDGTPTTAGNFSTTLSATNAGGTGSSVFTLTIKPLQPVVTSPASASGQAGLAFQYQIAATNSPTGYQVQGTLPNGLTVNPATGLISGTPTQEGVFNVTLQATNSGGTGTGPLTLTFAAAPPPSITSATGARGQVGKAFVYRIAATFFPTSYSATVLPTGLVLNTTTGVISGTPLTAGTYVSTLSAANDSGSGKADVTITIVPAAPAFTGATPPSGQVGVSYLYQITASNNPASFAASSLPPGLYLNSATGLISGTPTEAGTFTMSFSATNAGGTGSSGAFRVAIKPAVPVITSAASASGQVKKAFAYQIVATNSPASFNASGLPPGLKLDTATGRISGTPTTATNGVKVTLTATNAGGTGTATLTLAFTAQPQLKPVVTTSAHVTGTVSKFLSLALSATNAPSAYTVTGLPDGLRFVSGPFRITGTPTKAGTFYVNVSATNAHGTGPTARLTFTIDALPDDVLIKFLGPPSGKTFSTGAAIHPYVQVLSNAHTFKSLTLNAIYASGSQKPVPIGSSTGGTVPSLFSLPWMPPRAGVVKLQVIATDTANTAFPLSESITVKTSSTTNAVKLIDGLNGANFAPGKTVTLVADVDNVDAKLQGITFYANGEPFKTFAASAGVRVGTSAKRSFPPVTYQLPAAAEPVVFTVSTQTGSAIMADADTGSGNDAVDAAAKTILGSTGNAIIDALTLACKVTAPAAATNGTITIPAHRAGMAATAAVTKSSGRACHVQFFLNADQVAGDASAAPYSVTLPALNPGRYTLSAKATDDLGLFSAWSNPVPVTVAEVTPVINSALTHGGQVGTAFSYQITAANTPTSFGASSLPAGLSVNTTTGLISGVPQVSGTFKIGLSAINTAGTGAATLTLTILPAKPVIASPSTASGYVGLAFRYQIAASNSPTSFDAANLPLGLSVNQQTGLISGTPTMAGIFHLKVKATNAGGTVSAQVTVTIGGVPVITSATAQSGAVGTEFSYQITASGDPTSFGATPLPPGLGLNAQSGLISGRPTTAGVYTVTLTAANSAGTGPGRTLTLTILPAGAPMITSALSASVEVGAAFSYQIVAGNNPTSFGVLGLPPFLTVNASGLLSGTPPAAGTYTMRLTATNAVGTDTETFTLTVEAGTPTVTIVTAGDGMAVEGGEKGKVFIVRTGGDMSQSLTVHYKAKGSAKPGIDYKELSDSVTIQPDATKAKIKIKPIDNATVDPPRKLKLRLLPDPDGSYNIGDPAVAKIKVIDND